MGFLLPFKKHALVRRDVRPPMPIRNEPDMLDDVVFEVMSRTCLEGATSEPKIPCLISCDTSDSINEANALGQLNDGLPRFVYDMASDISCRSTLQVGIAKFGETSAFEWVAPFTPVPDLVVPQLYATGPTPF